MRVTSCDSLNKKINYSLIIEIKSSGVILQEIADISGQANCEGEKQQLIIINS